MSYKDENKVIDRIRDRMELGFKQYGALDLALDSRDLIEEAIQEALDMSIYLASRLEQIKMYQTIVEEDEYESYASPTKVLKLISEKE